MNINQVKNHILFSESFVNGLQIYSTLPQCFPACKNTKGTPNYVYEPATVAACVNKVSSHFQTFTNIYKLFTSHMFLSWQQCIPVLCQFRPSDTTSANASINTLTHLPAPPHHHHHHPPPPPACPAVAAAARHKETSPAVTGSVYYISIQYNKCIRPAVS